MYRTPRIAGACAAIAALAVTACGSAGSTGPNPAAASSAAAAASSAAAAQSAIASEVASQSAAADQPCTTRACIVADAKSLIGAVAKDNSVMTTLSCRKSSVKQATPGVWTVHCTATYSDGESVSGIASVLLAQNKVAWEATGVVSGG